ncbi:MAG TPA: hypothetical protein VFJ85_01190 [Acidimicrobiales bacterium]|nr:hypothetical protein [Acidimicrobiales bacterium]
MTAVALQLLPADDEASTRSLRPPGTFVQVLPGAVSAFCAEHGLDFDERALLEHLLDTAEHGSGVVHDCTLSGLARDLGLGPSGRRTLAARLGRLVSAHAIDWEPSWGSEPGRIEVLVYPRLVRGGRGDRRVGYVQVLPGALAGARARHDLSATAGALLRRLVVDVDHRTHVLTGSLRQLTTRYGLGRLRLTNALDELAAAGLLRRHPERLELPAYGDLVRLAAPPADPCTPRSDRAPAVPESRAPRVQNARPSSLLDGKDQDLEPKTPENTHAPIADLAQGQGPSLGNEARDSNLAALALALPEATHHELLADPAQAPGRQALRRRLERLVAAVGQADAVATVSRDWPKGVASPMALANSRAERRLVELAGASATGAAVAELAAQQATRRRSDALRGAGNLGRAWASAGATADDVAAEFAGDEEALETALGAFHAAQAAGAGTHSSPVVGIGRTARRRPTSSSGPQRLAFSLAANGG